jgi:GntR family transcriptional regulator
MSHFDPNSFVPLYIQIAQILRENIRDSVYKPGEKLPSEKELEVRYSISRITAISALDELVKERLAYRERGRGTFVARPVIGDLSFFSSFTEDMLAHGFKPSSRLIEIRKADPGPLTIQKLSMDPNETYMLIKRVRLADGEPVVLQEAYLPGSKFPGLDLQDFESHYLYEIIRQKYGYNLTWSEAIVEATAATSAEAGYLSIKPGTPVMMIWHLTMDDHYTTLEYVRSVYRSDRFSFSTGRNPLRSFNAG